MPVSQEEILKVIGFEDVEKFENVDAFKSAYDQRFIAKDRILDDEKLVNEITGRQLGAIETQVKRTFKEAGVAFDDSELKGKKLTDIAELATKKLVGGFQEQINTLKTAKGGDEVLIKEVESWKSKFEKLKDESSSFKELNEKLSQENEKLANGFQEKEKSWMINQQVKELFGGVKYKTAGIPDAAQKLVRSGFENKVKETFKFDLDESNKLVVLNADGSKVEDPRTSGKILGPLDAIKNLAVSESIWEDNANAGKKSATFRLGQSDTNAKPKRELHPARRRA